jgi:hypothetical protein
MKTYRLFLLSFVTTSLVFLTGFERQGATDAIPAEKKVLSPNKTNHVKPVQKIKTSHSALTTKEDSKEAGLQKSLDLSIPFGTSENSELNAQRESANIFANEAKTKSRPLDLHGQMLMSPEPEVGKQKTTDGAGLVITLKR